MPCVAVLWLGCAVLCCAVLCCAVLRCAARAVLCCAVPTTRWDAGAVPLLVDIVRDGSSAVQSAVVALEKLCSHSSGRLLEGFRDAAHSLCLCLTVAVKVPVPAHSDSIENKSHNECCFMLSQDVKQQTGLLLFSLL